MSDPAERQGTPSLGEFVEGRIDKRLAGLRVSLPAEVLSFEKEGPTISAQPLIDQAYIDEAGARRIERLPVVTDVPVVYFGGGGHRDTFPLEAGDLVLLIFASSSIARWKVTGQGGDPGDDRHHRLSDALAIPMSRGAVNDTARVIESDDLRLGTPLAIDAALKGDAYRAAEDTMLSAMSAAFALLLTNPTIAAWIVGLTAPQQAILGSFAASITAFQTADATYKSTRVKVG